MIGKSLRKIIEQLLLIFCILKKKKYSQLIFQNITQPVSYVAIKKLFALLHKKSSKRKGDFNCLNCVNSFKTENKLKSHEKTCKNKDFCGIAMPSKKNEILKFNQYMKSDNIPYIIYADIESSIKKIDGYANNSENSVTTETGEHIPCRYSMSTI